MMSIDQNSFAPPRSRLAPALAVFMVGLFVAAIVGVAVGAMKPASASKPESAQRQAAAAPARSQG
jgi:hypothetical protein